MTEGGIAGSLNQAINKELVHDDFIYLKSSCLTFGPEMCDAGFGIV